jgi:CMP-N,N'-diacetyllegionaminic acid synthase
MLNGDRTVALVPARGGSEGVPHTNVRKVGGVPLLAWSVGAARDTAAVDRTLVTTDDEEIAAVAREHGAEVIDRPAELATDDALVADAVRHALEWLRGDDETVTYVAMLEPTCPFRAPADVQKALELLAHDGLDSVASFAPAELNPHRAWRIDGDRPEPVIDGADPWQPRQQLPPAYELNGGVYAFVADELPSDGPALLFGEKGAVTMPPERSVDIDTPLDLEFARLVADREWFEPGG